jgi:hypothetical protein
MGDVSNNLIVVDCSLHSSCCKGYCSIILCCKPSRGLSFISLVFLLVFLELIAVHVYMPNKHHVMFLTPGAFFFFLIVDISIGLQGILFIFARIILLSAYTGVVGRLGFLVGMFFSNVKHFWLNIREGHDTTGGQVVDDVIHHVQQHGQEE